MSDTKMSRIARINWLLFVVVVIGGVTLFTVRVGIPYQRQMALVEEFEGIPRGITPVSLEPVGPDWL